MKAAAPAPNSARLEGSGTAVPPEELPDDPPELLLVGSFGGSFMASAGVAAAPRMVRAQTPVRT